MSCGDEIDRGFRGNSSLQAVCGANASIARTSYDFREFIYSFGEENTQYFLCKCKGTYIYTVAFQNMLLFLLGPPAVVVEIWRFACDEASAFSGGAVVVNARHSELLTSALLLSKVSGSQAHIRNSIYRELS